MNQPNDNPPTLEERVADLEKLFGDIIKNEQELIKLSKRQTFNVREISGVVGNIQLDIADMRERFDTIERTMATMATKEDIVEIKASQSEQSDLLRLILAELRGLRGE
jgi:hypothetical protein